MLFGKLAQETYRLHKNDAKNVNMWVQQNTNSMFYYQETRVEVDGGLTRQNMLFTLGTQTLWQREMMIEHGHQGGVAVDITFGTNEKKVSAKAKVSAMK
jgi:ubiquinone/menaquinone biosynthesis C-methylase UbiE